MVILTDCSFLFWWNGQFSDSSSKENFHCAVCLDEAAMAFLYKATSLKRLLDRLECKDHPLAMIEI